MKKLLFVDTETCGLPKSWSNDVNDTDNWPRILQLAWELCWENGETIRKRCDLVEPDGWEIPKEPFWIEHGYDTDTNLIEGLPMPELLGYFIEAYHEADVLIAHNLGFDKPVIICEMFRYGLKVKKKIDSYCTKLKSEFICKLPSQYPGKYKWPRLEEAYEFMFGKQNEGGHDAGWDVQACKEIYLWIQNHELMKEL